MKTILVWVLFQVFPYVEPISLADTAITCITLAQARQDEELEIILKCARIEILVEEI